MSWHAASISADSGAQRRPVMARAIELAVAAVLGPLLVLGDIWPPRLVMPLLMLGVLAAFGVVMYKRPSGAELGVGPSARAGILPTVRLGLAIWGVLVAATIGLHLATDQPLIPLATRRPVLMLLISCFYPISAIAQEFIFRGFFFWRYRCIAPLPVLAVLNAAAFGWVHIVYGSWISVILATLGGAIFVGLYLRYRSMWGVAIIHSVFGITVFAMGYGSLFYNGSRRFSPASPPPHAAPAQVHPIGSPDQ